MMTYRELMDTKKSGFVVWVVNPNKIGIESVGSVKVQSVNLFVSSDTHIVSVSVQTNSPFYSFLSPALLFRDRIDALKMAKTRAVDALISTKARVESTVAISSDYGLIPAELDGFQDLLAELDNEIAAEFDAITCKVVKE